MKLWLLCLQKLNYFHYHLQLDYLCLQELEKVLAPWRGHWMAKATVEMAFWDLWAKALGLPLKTLLGGTGDKVAVGVSLGL